MRQLVKAMGAALEQLWRHHAPRVTLGGHAEVADLKAALDAICEAAAVAPLSFVHQWQERQRPALPERVARADASRRTDDDDENDRLREARISARRKMRR